MEEEIREIRTPLELQAFLSCSDESLREICKLMVELAETEKPWTIPFVYSEEEIDEFIMKSNSPDLKSISPDLKREWLSGTQWKAWRPQLKRLQSALAEFDAYIFVRNLSLKDLELYELGVTQFGGVTLLKYAYPYAKRLGDAYFYSEDCGGSPSMAAWLSLNCYQECEEDAATNPDHISSENPLLVKMRQHAQEGRYDDMEDPATIPPFEYNKDLSMRDLYDDDELDEN